MPETTLSRDKIRVTITPAQRPATSYNLSLEGSSTRGFGCLVRVNSAFVYYDTGRTFLEWSLAGRLSHSQDRLGPPRSERFAWYVGSYVLIVACGDRLRRCYVSKLAVAVKAAAKPAMAAMSSVAGA